MKELAFSVKAARQIFAQKFDHSKARVSCQMAPLDSQRMENKSSTLWVARHSVSILSLLKFQLPKSILVPILTKLACSDVV
jgi:hypothetical protein